MVLVPPVAVWEFSFGVYMTFKGFKPSTTASSVDDAAIVRTVAA